MGILKIKIENAYGPASAKAWVGVQELKFA